VQTFRWALLISAWALGFSAAHADVKLINKDSKAHDITVKCKSTVQRSIQAGTTTSLGAGPCTVTVKSTGASMSGSGDDTLVIPKGK
jgi:hypothetical protein